MKPSLLFPSARGKRLGEAGFLFAVSGNIRAYLSPKKGKAFLYLLLGLLVGFFLLLFLFSVLLLLGAYSYAGSALIEIRRVLFLLFFYLLYGSAEEILCRGVLMPLISEHAGGTVGALVSAAFFALMHVANPGVSPLALWNIFLFGLLFASVTQCSKSLLPACGLHVGWNFAQSLCGVQISGNEALYAPLKFDSRISWLSGGAFGPEGSPILTFFLMALLAVMLLHSAKNQKEQTK